MNELEVSTRHAPGDQFGVLVQDHANLVYSAARRQLGNSEMVEDVVQAVFILLWRKAGSIRGSVAGWLVKTTHYACLDARKIVKRREFHEREAAAMKMMDLNTKAAESGWDGYAEVLDKAMAALSVKDRDAVALRYFRGLTFKEVGAAIGTKEDAAKKRVERAVDRLRKIMLSSNAAVPAASVLMTQLEDRGIEVAPHSLILKATLGASGTGAKGALVAAIVRKAGKRRMWPGIAAAALATIILTTSGSMFYLLSSADAGNAGGGNPTAAPASINQAAGVQNAPITLNVRAVIDGSDVLNITPGGASWSHIGFQEPTRVTLKGIPFDIHGNLALEKIGLANVDLSSAFVVVRSGRGTVAMDKITGGIAIHFSDPQPGASAYEITIGFMPKSAASKPPATKPADSIFVDVKAAIAGGDVLTITPHGAKWRHNIIEIHDHLRLNVMPKSLSGPRIESLLARIPAAQMIMDWPSNVSINGQPWNIIAQPDLNIDLANADFSSAEVVGRWGRDTVVMEKIDGGVVVYFCDAVGGMSDYEIKIGFPKLK